MRFFGVYAYLSKVEAREGILPETYSWYFEDKILSRNEEIGEVSVDSERAIFQGGLECEGWDFRQEIPAFSLPV